MKTTKYELAQFQFYSSEVITEHLSKMAQKGWQLDKITQFGWKYKKMQPQDLKYSVTYFQEASEFDPSPTQGQEVFFEYCKEAGWDFVTQWAQMQIFSSSMENPTPIETDEREKLTAIHRSMKKTSFPSNFMMIGISILQLYMVISRLIDSPVDFYSNWLSLFNTVAWVLLLICFILPPLNYYIWYKGSKKSVELGGSCLEMRRLGEGVSKFVTALALISLLLVYIGSSLSNQNYFIFFLTSLPVLVTCFTAIWLKNKMKEKGVSKALNFALTLTACIVLSFASMGLMTLMIFKGVSTGGFHRPPSSTHTITYPDGSRQEVDIYTDDIPLKIEDMQEVDYENYSYKSEEQSSNLVSKTTVTQRPLPFDDPSLPSLEYKIIDVKLSALFDSCLKECLKSDKWEKKMPEFDRRAYRKMQNASYLSDEAYQRYRGDDPLAEYVICFGNRIVCIHFEEIPSEAQLTIASQKLR
ncbi:MAG: DUF2812 domain-containing protein [Oscillospiraceae bacterium]